MQDEPYAERAEVELGEAIAHQVGASFPVTHSAGEQLRSNLDNDAQDAHVVRVASAKSNLEVAEVGRARPWFFGALHCFGDHLRQVRSKELQLPVAHRAVVGDVDKWHPSIMASRAGRNIVAGGHARREHAVD